MDTGERKRHPRFDVETRGIGADAPRGDSGGLGTGHLEISDTSCGWNVTTELLDITIPSGN